MKTFYITVAIFLSLILVIFFNFIYINRIAEKMAAFIDIIKESDTPEDEISSLDDFWKEKQITVGLSVSHLVIGKISESIACMKSYASSGDVVLLDREIAVLEETVKELRRLEQFSCDNIL